MTKAKKSAETTRICRKVIILKSNKPIEEDSSKNEISSFTNKMITLKCDSYALTKSGYMILYRENKFDFKGGVDKILDMFDANEYKLVATSRMKFRQALNEIYKTEKDIEDDEILCGDMTKERIKAYWAGMAGVSVNQNPPPAKPIKRRSVKLKRPGKIALEGIKRFFELARGGEKAEAYEHMTKFLSNSDSFNWLQNKILGRDHKRLRRSVEEKAVSKVTTDETQLFDAGEINRAEAEGHQRTALEDYDPDEPKLCMDI